VARKRTQAKRGGSSRKKTATSRAKTKIAATRRKTTAASRKKTTAASRKKTTAASRKKTTAASRSRAKKTATGRSKTKTAGRSKTASARSRSKTKTASRARSTASRSRKTAAVRSARRAVASRPSKTLASLDDVLKDQLADLYSAEKQLVDALPKVARAATHPQLRGALEQHLEETRGHVRRLEEIFRSAGMSAPSEHCEGMEGLVKEGEEVVGATGDPAAKDAALIAAAQRVEHYEIAGYGTARALADELGHDDAKGLLQETLDEEGKADELLTQLATGGMLRTGINEQALS